MGWDATAWNNATDIDPTSANLECGQGQQATFDTWTDNPSGHEDLPVSCVTWYEAYAFCIWDGGFLPSEAEWEYAAAGGSQQQEYPWGSMDPGIENQYAIYGLNYAGNSTDIAPLGTATLGAGSWGQLDLVGELDEWDLDWYQAYAACTDCADLAATTLGRVTRGGDFADQKSYLLPPNRFYFAPQMRANTLGFRCARVP
jgi:formylglycine-generating enzyme required for sulfatase activity